jgi:hypothetical protein
MTAALGNPDCIGRRHDRHTQGISDLLGGRGQPLSGDAGVTRNQPHRATVPVRIGANRVGDLVGVSEIGSERKASASRPALTVPRVPSIQLPLSTPWTICSMSSAIQTPAHGLGPVLVAVAISGLVTAGRLRVDVVRLTDCATFR